MAMHTSIVADGVAGLLYWAPTEEHNLSPTEWVQLVLDRLVYGAFDT